MSHNPPIPKGRAQLLMKLLAQTKEQKPGEQPPQAGEQPAEEVPKARGRAALMKKIAELKAAGKVGSESPSTSSAQPIQPSAVKKDETAAKVEEITAKVEATTLADPSYYKGTFLFLKLICGMNIR